MEELAKIQVRCVSGDSEDIETPWAKPVGPNLYQLDNILWYAYGISCDDVVEAIPRDGELPEVTRVVRKSGNRTVRVIFDPALDGATSHPLLDQLVAFGCSYEGAFRKLVAINIPPNVEMAAVSNLLTLSGQQWEHADPTYDELYPATRIVKVTVEAPRLTECVTQLRALLATVEAGGRPDWDAVSQSLGTEIVGLLNSLFKLDETTVKYWIDDVLLRGAEPKSAKALALTGRAWCADHRRQWEVPLKVEGTFQEAHLRLLRLLVGDAARESLENHIGRSVTKSAYPTQWLVAFDVEPS